MTTNTVKLEISVRGETRTVEATTWQPLDDAHALHTGKLFTATIGRGVARYPAGLILFRVAEGERPQPGNKVVTDEAGRRWEYHMGAVVRNRQAMIVGWDDVATPTNLRDQTRV